MDEGKGDQSTGRPDLTPPIPGRQPRRAGAHRRPPVPPSTTPTRPDGTTPVPSEPTRTFQHADVPPLALETLIAQINAEEKQNIFDLIMDQDVPDEFTRADGTKFLTEKELKTYIKEHGLPEKLVVSDAIIEAILRNPDEKLKVGVARATKEEWLIQLKSEMGEGKIQPSTAEWTGSSMADLETPTKEALRLPRGFDVIDTLEKVPEGLREELRAKYGNDISERVLSALIGQRMHDMHYWDMIKGDVAREHKIFTDSGEELRPDAYRPEKLKIGELKSDTPSEIVKAVGQLLRYIWYLNRNLGIQHSGEVHVYHKE